MYRYRVEKRSDAHEYSAISGYHLREVMSLEAKGLLTLAISLWNKRPDFPLTIDFLFDTTIEDNDKVREIISELKMKGYCKVDRNGDYTFYDFPVCRMEIVKSDYHE